ncbi:hypothetical protein GWI33_004198 [Rhynchophorus ferrugineus]|uniref:Uncharacterized protein n=1 Tax=Rhynchophorus ferrugineus TaxID=354439 RepID=A0A834IZB9_RHYFE|nr:hypothetical protein GWI33_004198 [Rhynchophorus ferrugineus]
MHNFTIIVILACTFVSALAVGDLTPEQRQRFFNFQNECMQETGATDDMILKAFRGELTDSPLFKDHLVCLGLKSGVVDKEGNYHKEVLKKEIMMFTDDGDKLDKLLDRCYEKHDTQQETAFKMMQCIFKEHFGH